jgi:hypothetical protein
MTHSDKMAQLFPKPPHSLFIPFFDFQGYDGDIKTHLHTGVEFSSSIMAEHVLNISATLDSRSTRILLHAVSLRKGFIG